MNTLQRLDELIEESREIEAHAEKLQADGPLYPASPYDIQQVRERTEAWITAALEILPADLNEEFEAGWNGPDGDCGQQHFVAEPTGTGLPPPIVFNDEYLQTIEPGSFRFTFPFERCFQNPMRRQRRILLNARHHPDIVQRARANDRELTKTEFDLNDLHSRVVTAAGALFADGNFRDSIFRACTALSEVIKERSGIVDRDGTKLVEHVFSFEKPILTIAGNEDERRGMLWLLKGAVMGLRNSRAHRQGEGEDVNAVETFEWLAFISALVRKVDRAEQTRMDEQ